MGIPTPYMVQTKQFSEGPEKDSRGSLVKKWAEPVSQPAIAIGPKERLFSEPHAGGYDRVLSRRQVFVPPDFIAGPQDKMIIPAHRNEPELEYEVLGYPEDYNDGPWGYQPGLVVRVQRVEG